MSSCITGLWSYVVVEGSVLSARERTLNNQYKANDVFYTSTYICICIIVIKT